MATLASGSVASTTPATAATAAVASRAPNRTAAPRATCSTRPQASNSGATSWADSWMTRNVQASKPVA